MYVCMYQKGGDCFRESGTSLCETLLRHGVKIRALIVIVQPTSRLLKSILVFKGSVRTTKNTLAYGYAIAHVVYHSARAIVPDRVYLINRTHSDNDIKH